MVVLLAVLGAIYSQAKQPRTWSWLTEDGPSPAALGSQRPASTSPAVEPQPPDAIEQVTSGSNDLDRADFDAARREFDALSDRSPLTRIEMPAYWRCLQWARSQSFTELQKRAQRDVPFTQLWEQPERYRGQLLLLRLHVRRVLEYEAPENPAGLSRTYEIWGWTDESRSFPYVVVCSELPPGMTVGTSVHAEAVFAGYFLKNMSYVASDAIRAAPLLAGRLTPLPQPRITGPADSAGSAGWYWLIGVAVLVSVATWGWRRSRAPRCHSLGSLNSPELPDWIDPIGREPSASKELSHGI
jgi:hypothetical protein